MHYSTTVKFKTTTFEVPAWIEIDRFDISEDAEGTHIVGEEFLSALSDLANYGCASGSYMPAVIYHTARETMNEHGDAVLAYIEDNYGELPSVPQGESWSGIAVFYLSTAVELWASSTHAEIEDAEDIEEEEEDN